MKGLSSIILGLIIMVVLILVFVGIVLIFNPFGEGGSGLSTTGTPIEAVSRFDYSAFIVGKSAKSYNQESFCKALLKCIAKASHSDEPCKIVEYTYGSDLSTEVGQGTVMYPFISCSGEAVNQIGPNISQEICKYSATNYIYSNRSSDYSGLRYGNCIKGVGASLIDTHGSNNIEEIYDGKLKIYYSADTLYTQGGFEDKDALDDYYFGPGRYEYYVSKVSDDKDDCKITAYVCTLPFLAFSNKDASLKVFDTFKTIGLRSYYNDVEMPYYIRSVTDGVESPNVQSYIDAVNDLKDMQKDFAKNNAFFYAAYILSPDFGTNIFMTFLGMEKKDLAVAREVLYFNTKEVDLGSGYPAITIINAIKQGIYQNTLIQQSTWSQPHWTIKKDTDIKYDAKDSTKCWKGDFDDTLKAAAFEKRKRAIYYNCGDDGICSGNLVINAAYNLDTIVIVKEKTDISVPVPFVRARAALVMLGGGPAGDVIIDRTDTSFLSGVIAFCGE